MTLLAQKDCCSMLGIDPKTLHHWLRQAHMQLCPHPMDARLRCLTPEQVQQLASLHARSLAMSPDSSPSLPAVASSPDHTAPAQHPIPATVHPLPETEWRKAVTDLSAQVITLQEQLTQLRLFRSFGEKILKRVPKFLLREDRETFHMHLLRLFARSQGCAKPEKVFEHVRRSISTSRMTKESHTD